MKHINKFNESWFKKDKKEDDKSDIIPTGVISSTGRPSEDDINKYKKARVFLDKPIDHKVDKYFIQEVSDRLHGPDSEEYVKALKELNNKFKAREGRKGSDFYEGD